MSIVLVCLASAVWGANASDHVRRVCEKATTEAAATPYERLNALLRMAIHLVPSSDFDDSQADQLYRQNREEEVNGLLELVAAEKFYGPIAHTVPGLFAFHPLIPTQQVPCFRRMNYLKYFVVRERQRLAPIRRLTVKHVEPLEAALLEALKIRNMIVRANTRLVKKVLRGKFDPEGAYQSDLLAHLLYLVENFDYSLGYLFSTYAEGSLQKRLFTIYARTSRDRERFAATDSPILSQAEDEHDMGGVTYVGRSELSQALQAALKECDERQRHILELRYGLTGREPMTLKEVAVQLGLTGERVRQIEEKAMEIVRRYLPQPELVGN